MRPCPPLEGTFLDLGCGWGAIALALALESPEATVYAVDVNERAIELARSNAEANGCGNIHAGTAAVVPGDVRFDVIWSNPPIRIGKGSAPRTAHGVASAPRLRRPCLFGGAAQSGLRFAHPWLAEHLGDGYEVGKYASSKGYRVIDVHKLA
mgnify:CR=1 FL=1